MLPTAARQTAPAAAQAGTGSGERRGWLAVAALTTVVAATWAGRLAIPFGDSHAGRIEGRYALHLHNLREEGLLGSMFGADWAPYSADPYAHHPPLRNLLDALFGSLPGDAPYQLRIAPLLLALLAVPAAAWLLRGFGLGWAATLGAVGLMVATGYFWIYAPLRYDLGIILALSALVVQVRHRPHPPPWMVVTAGVLALMAALQSWPGIAFAGALGLWLLASRRRFDRVVAVVGAGTVIGVAVSVAYMVGVHGVGGLAGAAETRAGGGFTLVEFVARQGRYAMELLPVWYLVLLPVAVLAGLWARRTRFYTGLTTVFAVGWVLVLNNGAYVHDYWAFLVLPPGLVGMGALLDRLANLPRARPPALAGGLLAVGLAVAVALGAMAFGGTNQRYVQVPADAGRLVESHPPPAGQEYAWHGGLAAPRWLAYYWDLSPRAYAPEPEPAGAPSPGPDDLVLVNLDRLPDWLPDSAVPEPLAQEGRYALLRAADLPPAA